MSKIRPMNDYVLVKPYEQADMTFGGLYVPDTAKDKAVTGEVVATGKGVWTNGDFRHLNVKPGDKVMFRKFAGREVEDGLLMFKEDEIIGVFES